MACPKCKCKVTYYHSGPQCSDYQKDRCSACGHVFYLMDSEEDDDLSEV